MRLRALLVLVPVLAIAIVAVGLRIGAGDAMRAAIVHGAHLPRGGGRLAWQVVTLFEDTGVRETITTPLHVTARTGGHETHLDTRTNADGVAELDLDMPGLTEGAPLTLDVRDANDHVLASGAVRWKPEEVSEVRREFVRPSLREGALAIDVAVLGARLAPGQAGRLFVRVADRATGRPATGARVEDAPEDGVIVTASPHPACEAGWFELSALPQIHVAGLTLRATDELGKKGRWFGSLPIAPGALWIDAPTRVPPGAVNVGVTSASARDIAYVEVDDESGRLFSISPKLAGASPQAHVVTPTLDPGKYWLVVSGEPDGAIALSGATRAMPLVVGGAPGCDADLAGLVPGGFPRWVALDGFDALRAKMARRRARGRALALGALLLSALLETLLLVRAARRSRLELARVEEAIAKDAPASRAPARRDATDLLIALLLGLMGLALLFALIEWQG